MLQYVNVKVTGETGVETEFTYLDENLTLRPEDTVLVPFGYDKKHGVVTSRGKTLEEMDTPGCIRYVKLVERKLSKDEYKTLEVRRRIKVRMRALDEQAHTIMYGLPF